MKFLNGNEEVFKDVTSADRPTLAMLIANENYVKDVDGRYFKESAYDKHEVLAKGIYNELIIKVQEVR